MAPKPNGYFRPKPKPELNLSQADWSIKAFAIPVPALLSLVQHYSPSIRQPVCQSVGNDCAFWKNRLTVSRKMYGVVGWMGRRNVVLDGVQIPHCKWQIFWGVGEWGGLKESCIIWACTVPPPGKYDCVRLLWVGLPLWVVTRPVTKLHRVPKLATPLASDMFNSVWSSWISTKYRTLHTLS